MMGCNPQNISRFDNSSVVRPAQYRISAAWDTLFISLIGADRAPCVDERHLMKTKRPRSSGVSKAARHVCSPPVNFRSSSESPLADLPTRNAVGVRQPTTHPRATGDSTFVVRFAAASPFLFRPQNMCGFTPPLTGWSPHCRPWLFPSVRSEGNHVLKDGEDFHSSLPAKTSASPPSLSPSTDQIVKVSQARSRAPAATLTRGI